MKSANRITAIERNRAVARLRSITVGTTLAALTASGIFGGIAAATWSGNSAGNTADLLTTAGPAPTSPTTTSETTGSGSTTTAQPTSTPTPTIRPSATPATTSTSAGQVTSGGS